MPWRETSVMDERLRFVARLLEGEGMSEVCRDFGISRKTGYKIFNRYKEDGIDALTDRSRRPVRYANQLPAAVEAMIVRCKKEKPRWGAREIRELLVRRLAGDVRIPARSTVHAVLDRHGLVAQARNRARHRAQGTPLSEALAANDLWCADFKGEFKLGDGRYCYPLTITDQASRYLLCCEAFESTREQGVFEAFRRVFAEHGLPSAIRSDNGLPFASPNGLYNLSKLSVWWLRLGIGFERIRPGHPQENGRHERMHLTLKKEATRPPGRTLLQQQARFDAFVSEFNEERPHEALSMKVPAELYAPSRVPIWGCRKSTIPSMTATPSSPIAAGFAFTARRSTSPPCWLDRSWELRKSMTAFGSSASCAMILDISTWNRGHCKQSTTRLARGCHLCLRDKLLPMSPGRTLMKGTQSPESNPGAALSGGRRLRVLFRPIALDPVPSALLGEVERLVGPGDQRGQIVLAIGLQRSDADAGGRGSGAAVLRHDSHPLNRAAQALCNSERCGFICADEERGKFLATKAAEQLVGRESRLRCRRKGRQNLVAHQVAVAVIDGLEVVDVHHQ